MRSHVGIWQNELADYLASHARCAAEQASETNHNLPRIPLTRRSAKGALKKYAWDKRSEGLECSWYLQVNPRRRDLLNAAPCGRTLQRIYAHCLAKPVWELLHRILQGKKGGPGDWEAGACALCRQQGPEGQSASHMLDQCPVAREMVMSVYGTNQRDIASKVGDAPSFMRLLRCLLKGKILEGDERLVVEEEELE